MGELEILGRVTPAFREILTDDAVAFVADLARTFTPRVDELLTRRKETAKKLDAGTMPDFLAETKSVRDGDWTGPSIPKDLQDRRVEITGPVERKMIINALNSGAKVFMADFEDSNTPLWENQIDGQINLRDAIRGTITFEQNGKHYKLNDKIATLLVRPRGWHLWDKYLKLDGKPVPGALADFGFYFFHNAKALIAKGSGPYFYLPKMQSHLEARLWNDVFVRAQEKLGVPRGTIRATVLIETLPAAFEMDEIIYELREHSAGLNCGRWDYMFSFIKTFRARPEYVMPDRALVTMTQPFMKAYTELLIKTCHRRNVHAMGGMAAQIPIKNDEAANNAALEKVKADKLREVKAGHDGTWVAHPGLVPIAMEIFDAHMKTPNQIANKREDVHTTAKDLVLVPEGPRTEKGLRQNIDVGVRYLEAWLRGLGCVPLYNLMEDAATAEISRTQVWQWVRYRAHLDDGREINPELFTKIFDEEMKKIHDELGDKFGASKFAKAKELFRKLTLASTLEDFLTLPAYDALVAAH